MPAILRARSVASLLLVLFALPVGAHADAPAPSQALASDPEPGRPSLGLSADGAAIVLADYAARLDVSLVPALSVAVVAGASHRRATDDVLLELGATVWFLGIGLEGPHLTAMTGLAWAAPSGQEDSVVVRAGGEAGWQFLWETLTISLAAGAHAAVDPAGGVWIEPRARAALGILL